MRALLILILSTTAALAFDPAPVPGRNGMVVTAQHLATEVGIDVLKQGGNAIDAAVAVGYALAVTYPAAGNLGGGGFMTVRLADGTTGFLDFREKAPLAATPGMFLDASGAVAKGRSTDTWLANRRPRNPCGLEAARAKWGHMTAGPDRPRHPPRPRRLHRRTQRRRPASRPGPKHRPRPRQRRGLPCQAACRPPPADASSRPTSPTHWTCWPSRARTPSTRAPSPRPSSPPAGKAAEILQEADFPALRGARPAPHRLRLPRLSRRLCPAPQLGGVVLCETLAILEGYDLKGMGFHSAAAVHVMTEALRQAYYDRNNRLGDPDFIQNPIAELTSHAYAARIRARIDPAHARPSAQVAELPHEGANTTQFSIMDAAGNAVSVTYTLNDWFGARRMAPGTGVMLNNEMDDFTAKPGEPNGFGLVQGTANAVAPGKTPLSSMTPSILVKDGKVAAVLGSPGGSRIITIVLNAVLNLIDYDMTVQEAVDAPRLHHQWLPDTIYAERFALSPDTKAALATMGHTVTEQAPWGIAEAIITGGPRLGLTPPGSSAQSLILVAPDHGGAMMFGAHDPRGGAGSAAGY